MVEGFPKKTTINKIIIIGIVILQVTVKFSKKNPKRWQEIKSLEGEMQWNRVGNCDSYIII